MHCSFKVTSRAPFKMAFTVTWTTTTFFSGTKPFGFHLRILIALWQKFTKPINGGTLPESPVPLIQRFFTHAPLPTYLALVSSPDIPFRPGLEGEGLCHIHQFLFYVGLTNFQHDIPQCGVPSHELRPPLWFPYAIFWYKPVPGCRPWIRNHNWWSRFSFTLTLTTSSPEVPIRSVLESEPPLPRCLFFQLDSLFSGLQHRYSVAASFHSERSA